MRAALLPGLLIAAFAVACEGDCPKCSPCPRWATMAITDALHPGPVSGATVVGGDVPWTCSEVDGATHCTSMPWQLPVAEVAITVAAPGYLPKDLQLAPSGYRIDRCGCEVQCPEYLPNTVALVRAP